MLTQVVWGNVDKSNAFESFVFEKAQVIQSIKSNATSFIVHINPINQSHAQSTQKYRMNLELRLPNKRDLHCTKEGTDLYSLFNATKRALISQVQKQKTKNIFKHRHQSPKRNLAA